MVLLCIPCKWCSCVFNNSCTVISAFLGDSLPDRMRSSPCYSTAHKTRRLFFNAAFRAISGKISFQGLSNDQIGTRTAGYTWPDSQSTEGSMPLKNITTYQSKSRLVSFTLLYVYFSRS